jgi:hypothetical protein
MTTYQTTANPASLALPNWLRGLVAAIAGPRVPAATLQSLNEGDSSWIGQPQGRRVTCEAGRLWLAFDGESRDIVLEAGESHLCATASPLSIHALATATVRIG